MSAQQQSGSCLDCLRTEIWAVNLALPASRQPEPCAHKHQPASIWHPTEMHRHFGAGLPRAGMPSSSPWAL